MVVIAIVAVGSIDGDTLRHLASKPGLGLSLAGVNLDGERLLGTEHLEQEGQPPEAGVGGFAQYRHAAPGDQLGQRRRQASYLDL